MGRPVFTIVVSTNLPIFPPTPLPIDEADGLASHPLSTRQSPDWCIGRVVRWVFPFADVPFYLFTHLPAHQSAKLPTYPSTHK